MEVDYYSGQRTGATLLTTAGTEADVADVQCGTTGKVALVTAGVTAANGASLVVRCPTNCAGQAGDVYNDGAYLFTSSICRAAVHAGVIVNGDGGIVTLTLSAGGNLPRTFTGKGPGCWHGLKSHQIPAEKDGRSRGTSKQLLLHLPDWTPCRRVYREPCADGCAQL